MTFKFLGKQPPYALEPSLQCSTCNRFDICDCEKKHFCGALKEAADVLKLINNGETTMREVLGFGFESDVETSWKGFEKMLRVSAGDAEK